MHIFLLCLFAFVFLLPSARSMARESTHELLHFSKKHEEVLIVKVINSDAMILEDGRKVKLIGVESAGLPKRKYVERDKNGIVIEEKEDPDIPLEEQALTYAADLLEGKKVRMEFDIDAVARDGKHLVYAFLPDGRLANAELLRQGFVYLKIRPPNVKYEHQLRGAYQEGKREQRGFLAN